MELSMWAQSRVREMQWEEAERACGRGRIREIQEVRKI